MRRARLLVRMAGSMTDRRVLLVTSNGFGMGHLVRQLAIANALGDNVRIMTLSQAAPTAIAGGAVLEYCPSYTSPWISKRAWHRGYLRDRIIALADEIGAEVIAFDGVVPYVGLLDALRRLDVASVWFRRGVWRADTDPTPLRYSSFFDLIIEPGDLGAPRDAGPTAARRDAVRIGVVTQAGPPRPRTDAALTLGVDARKLTVMFNVGSNAIPGLDAVIHAIAARGDINVITTKDALGRDRSASTGSVRALTGVFPLHPHLSAVDLAITSVGYNAAHEFVASGVPTVLVPANNVTDDQRARALAMQDFGVSVVVEASQPQLLQEVIERLLDDENERQAMALSARTIAAHWGDGAREAAELLRTVTRSGRTHWSALMRLRARLFVEFILGLRDRRRPIAGVEFTTDLVGKSLDGPQVIEHLHPDTGAAYLQRRQRIASIWFGTADGPTR